MSELMEQVTTTMSDLTEYVQMTMSDMRLKEYVSTRNVLVGVTAGVVVFWILKKKYKIPPGPFAMPLIGNYKLLTEKFVFDELEKYTKKYGPVFTVYMGPLRTVVLNNIECVTECLVTKGADFADRVHVISGDEFSEGCKDIAQADYTPTWKFHRKIVSKAFRNYLKGDSLDVAIQGSMEQVIKCIKDVKGPINPKQYIDLTVFNIICALCFNTKYKLDDKEFRRIIDIDDEITKTFGIGVFEDAFPYLRHIWPSKRYKQVFSLADEFYDYVNKHMAKHKETFDPDNVVDFCDHLLNEKRIAEEEDTGNAEHITETHVRQTILDIFFAGIDTSRFTLYWTFLYLAGHPDIQRKCQDEIREVIGDGRLPSILDKANLPYTEAMLHEVMRIRPVAPLGVPHAARVDSTIGGYDIPKGTMVVMNVMALHMDPKKWKNPETFDPTRYLDSDGNMAPKPENWLPFSAGRRVCLGESIAKPELVTIIATFLQQFNMKMPEGKTADFTMDGNSFALNPLEYELIIEPRL